MHIVKRWGFVAAACCVLVAGEVGTASAALIYDVDFSSDVVGTAPAIGQGPFPRTIPSDPPPSWADISRGIVVDSAGPLSDRPLLLGGSDNSSFVYEQLFFDMPLSNMFVDSTCLFGGVWGPECVDYDRYVISFDLVVFDQSPLFDSGFAFFVDAPEFRRLDFASDGSINILGVSVGLGTFLTIGSFEFGDQMAVTVDVNLSADYWAIRIDETELYRGAFRNVNGGEAYMNQLRFSVPSEALPSAAVDNISVIATPEPGSLLLLALGLGGLGLRGRVRRD